MKKRALRAFTLTEMLVVLVIIGLLAAVIGPRLFNRLDDAKRRTALLQIANLEAAVEMYRIDIGRLPTKEEGLRALVEAPANQSDWTGPYLSKSALPKDPWGNEYAYEIAADGAAFRVISFGADGKPGGMASAGDLPTRPTERAILGQDAAAQSTATVQN